MKKLKPTHVNVILRPKAQDIAIRYLELKMIERFGVK